MPRLVILHGHTPGQPFVTEDKPLIIGRSRSADIPLEGGNVSRKHARVFSEGQRWFVEDLGSSNGTFINDQQITGQMPLSSNDLLRIGSHLLRFETETPPDDGMTIHRQTAALASNAELYRENAARKLQIVLELSHHLANSLETDTLLSRLLDQLLVLFPHADRSLVILFGASGPFVRAHRDRTDRPADSPPFSRSLLSKVLQDGIAVLAEDTEAFQSNLTLNAMGVRSLICVPLQTHGGRPFGALQLDRFQSGRPFAPDDLHLLTAIALQFSMVLENSNLHLELVAKERMQRDLALARDIQQGFLPRAFPSVPAGPIDLVGELHPALEVSGDFYDYAALDDRHLALFVADVSGKGMPAALFMTMVRALLREFLQRNRNPSEVIAQLNDSLARDNPTFMYVTLLLAIYDAATGGCVLSRAGHPPAILRRHNGSKLEVLDPSGCLLGIVAPCPPLEQVSFCLEPGDALFLYTDGVTEAASETEELFGAERLLDVVRRLPSSESLQDWNRRIRDEVTAFTHSTTLQDDITLLILRRPVPL